MILVDCLLLNLKAFLILAPGCRQHHRSRHSPRAIDLDAELLVLLLIIPGVENLEKTLPGEQGSSSLLSLPSSPHHWLPTPLFFPSLAPSIPSTPSPFLSLTVREGQLPPGNLHVAM